MKVFSHRHKEKKTTGNWRIKAIAKTLENILFQEMSLILCDTVHLWLCYIKTVELISQTLSKVLSLLWTQRWTLSIFNTNNKRRRNSSQEQQRSNFLLKAANQQDDLLHVVHVATKMRSHNEHSMSPTFISDICVWGSSYSVNNWNSLSQNPPPSIA